MSKSQKALWILAVVFLIMNVIAYSLQFYKADPNRKYISLKKLQEVSLTVATPPNDQETSSRLLSKDGTNVFAQKYNSHLSLDKLNDFYVYNLIQDKWILKYKKFNSTDSELDFCKNGISLILNISFYNEKSYYEKAFRWTNQVQSDEFCPE